MRGLGTEELRDFLCVRPYMLGNKAKDYFIYLYILFPLPIPTPPNQKMLRSEGPPLDKLPEDLILAILQFLDY